MMCGAKHANPLLAQRPTYPLSQIASLLDYAAQSLRLLRAACIRAAGSGETPAPRAQTHCRDRQAAPAVAARLFSVSVPEARQLVKHKRRR